MSELNLEITNFINILQNIDEIDNMILRLQKKSFKVCGYYFSEICLGFILVILGINSLLYFITYSKDYIGTDLLFVFFYNNNIFLAIVIIVLIVTTSFEFAIFILDNFTFKNYRHRYKARAWIEIYEPKIKALCDKKNYYKQILSSDHIPNSYLNLDCLYFFKDKIKKSQASDIDTLINSYKEDIIRKRNNQLISKLTRSQKK